MHKSPSVLDRGLYSIAEAAHLLGLPPVTLRRWLEGYTSNGRFYEPVLRLEPTGSETVTWGEFVEAGLLRGYRDRGVSLHNRLRPFINDLRERLGVPYPLAHGKPGIGPNRHLIRLAEDAAGLALEDERHQRLISPLVEDFIDAVDWGVVEEVAERYWPLGREHNVVIDPDRAFGIPTVEGLRAEVLAELVNAGEPIAFVADEYGISEQAVRDAVEWESRRGVRAA